MKYKLFHVFLLLTISLFAVRYLLAPGFIPTHDGEFHFVRFWQFEKMIRAGDYFPIWAPDLNSGYGLPLFYYHYPMPNYVGVLFHQLGFSYTDAFKLILASFYIVAVIFFYVWSQSLWGALLFGWTPYWFVNLFVRGSIGEVMASAGFAFVLWATGARRKVLIALGVAFIILSHNIAAMLFIPVVGVYAWRRSLRQVLLGILIAAYFWLPAVTGGSYVQGLSNINFADHFSELSQLLIPGWGTGFSGPGTPYDEMSQQLGLGAVLIGFATIPQSYILILIAFMTTGSSLFIWKSFPFLQILQYPWRFLMYVPFIVGSLAKQMPKRFAAPVAAISVLVALPYTKPVVYESRNDEYYLSRREFTDGTASIGNSISTRWTPWKSERANQKIEIIEGSGSVHQRELKPTRYNFTVDAATPVTVRVNTVYFPGWQVSLNSHWSDLVPDEDGLMRISLLPGTHSAIVVLHNTRLRQFALGISLASFIWLIVSGILENRYAYSHRRNATLQRT